jgi:hypothetical protein
MSGSLGTTGDLLLSKSAGSKPDSGLLLSPDDLVADLESPLCPPTDLLFGRPLPSILADRRACANRRGKCMMADSTHQRRVR